MYNTESYRKHQEFIDSKSDETYIKELYNHNSPIHHYNQLFFEFLNPFVEPASAWLTVGDSTGIDAAYLKKQGGVATASDLSTKTLERVFAQQLIDGFSVQNVEQLSYPNNSFDYVCCKEAYHHFPRPAIGFYEMLRVARKGVVIIEPSDINLAYPVLLFVRNILDRISPKLLRKIWKNQYSYEIVGNFVYKISFREFEKMAAALDLPCVAYAGFNTMMGARWDAQFVQKLKRFFVDMLCKISLLPYQHLSLVVFKEKPSETTRKKMQQMGYKIYDLPKNPYN
ncbi:MAG: class I SAM-dependent methyltransferase [Cytophagia bacterium]|nr:MAG: class I SAM-dependent methyltransferase [Runella sp.]TAG22715.1 MAG: class I SAM-dependent methyltransferase [Cytophagales bacterium]TAG41817.1 MAG: class I SAM-dependent methyltransferase [Cytophagia bacterium]TAG83538.1 MAG: class I SAM-dependent methyltransferase [Cytophagales bacterium]